MNRVLVFLSHSILLPKREVRENNNGTCNRKLYRGSSLSHSLTHSLARLPTLKGHQFESNFRLEGQNQLVCSAGVEPQNGGPCKICRRRRSSNTHHDNNTTAERPMIMIDDDRGSWNESTAVAATVWWLQLRRKLVTDEKSLSKFSLVVLFSGISFFLQKLDADQTHRVIFTPENNLPVVFPQLTARGSQLASGCRTNSRSLFRSGKRLQVLLKELKVSTAHASFKEGPVRLLACWLVLAGCFQYSPLLLSIGGSRQLPRVMANTQT